MTKQIPDLILASGSAARKAMLASVGITFTAKPADLNETEILNALLDENESPSVIALELAAAKALHIAAQNPEALVIGSDQILECEGKLLSKATNLDDARDKLKSLRGKTHRLISAVCIARGEHILWSLVDTASLHMRDFDDDFLEAYIKSDPDALLNCVGGYKIEGAGAWLFTHVQGDHYTIMGMPLLPLLDCLITEYGYTP